MKLFVTILAFVTVCHAANIGIPSDNPVYGYLVNIGIPEAERIRKSEEQLLSNQRIVGGNAAAAGAHPWQAGLLIDIIGESGNGVCGASLLSANTLITAAHCWYDGKNQAWRFTVILGTNLLFSGGERIQTTNVIEHPNWNPSNIRNDVAIIKLPSDVSFNSLISPISLPSGSEVSESFAGETAVASGFGITSDGGSISSNHFLSEVQLEVITNTRCFLSFPFILQSSNICTSGSGGTSTCSGDSGGPLSVRRNDRNVLIGITSFGLALGCQRGYPAAFARVTSFLSFINQNL